jgi:hypothetical protein
MKSVAFYRKIIGVDGMTMTARNHHHKIAWQQQQRV